MNWMRIIHEITPEVMRVPEDLRHGRSGITARPLEFHASPERGAPSRRLPPPALAGKAREGGVMTSAPAFDWGLEE